MSLTTMMIPDETRMVVETIPDDNEAGMNLQMATNFQDYVERRSSSLRLFVVNKAAHIYQLSRFTCVGSVLCSIADEAVVPSLHHGHACHVVVHQYHGRKIQEGANGSDLLLHVPCYHQV